MAREHGTKSGDETWDSRDESICNDIDDLTDVPCGNDLLDLPEVSGTEACQGILQLRVSRDTFRQEMIGWYVEELEDQQELLCREGTVPTLDLAETALRKAELAGQLRLRPGSLPP